MTVLLEYFGVVCSIRAFELYDYESAFSCTENFIKIRLPHLKACKIYTLSTYALPNGAFEGHAPVYYFHQHNITASQVPVQKSHNNQSALN